MFPLLNHPSSCKKRATDLRFRLPSPQKHCFLPDSILRGQNVKRFSFVSVTNGRNDHVSCAIPSRAALVTAFLVLCISSRRFCTVFPIRLCPNLIEKHCCQIAKRNGWRENTVFPAFSLVFTYHCVTKIIIFAPSFLSHLWR